MLEKMNRWMNTCMCMYEWVHVWMHESRNKLISGFINEWMTEAFMPIDGWMIEWFCG